MTSFDFPAFPDATGAPEAPLLREAQQLTEQFLVHFYHHDARWCLRLLADDASYLGTTRQGIAFTSEQLRTVMLELLGTFNPSLVLSLECLPSMLPGGAILMLTQFYLVSDPANGAVRAVRRRGTLVWVPTPHGLRIRHMHFSVPHHVDSGYDDQAPITHDTYLYAKAVVEQIVRHSSIPLTDVNGTLHHLSPVEVRHVEAQRQYTVIHCLGRTIMVRRGFGAVCALLGDDLVVVRRGHALNPTYLLMVTREAAVLDDDTTIALPKRHARAVRLQLQELLVQRMLGQSALIPRTAAWAVESDDGGA